MNHFDYFYSFADRLTFAENPQQDCYGYAQFSEEYTHNALGGSADVQEPRNR